MSGQGDNVAEKFYVLIGKANGGTCLISTRLLRSASRVNADRSCAERVPNVANGASEPIAVGEQQHDGSDTPGHSKHRQHCLAQVVTHGPVSFSEDVARHLLLLPPQCFYGFKQRGLSRGIQASDHTRERKRSDGEHGSGWNQAGSVKPLRLWQQAQERHKSGSARHADSAAHYSQKRAFGEKLEENTPVRGA